MASSQAEEDAAGGEGGGGWGISSVSAAFGGWGLGAADEGGAAADQKETSYDADSPSTYQDDEWKRQSKEVEAAAATAAHELEDAATAAAEAASNFFTGASNYFMSGAEAAEEDAAEEGADGPDAPKPVTSDEGATTENDGLEGGDGEQQQTEGPQTFVQILERNPLTSIASHWIGDLEKQSEAQDPHRLLRQHLEAHLVDWPKSTYEEWVEEALVAIEGWDRGSAVVDDTFYREASTHRNLWNERMAVDDPDAGGTEHGEGAGEDDDEREVHKKRYVPARGAKAVIATPPRGAKEGTSTPAPATATVATPPRSTPAAKIPSTPATAGGDEDADLDGLLGEVRTASALLASTEKVAADAIAVGDNEDADLEGLIGGDEDEEVVFVSPPSGGVDLP